MTFNVTAIPIAPLAVAWGIGVSKLSLKITKLSDRMYARHRSLEEQDTSAARLGVMSLAVGIGLALISLFAPLWS